MLKRIVRGFLVGTFDSLYLERAAKKLSTAEQRAKVVTISEPILARLRVPAGAFGTLTTEERAKVEHVAQECADLFKRSSSCVEGRNGQLALRHHSLHWLTKGKLAALTVLHNYYVTNRTGRRRRSDSSVLNQLICSAGSWVIRTCQHGQRPSGPN